MKNFSLTEHQLLSLLGWSLGSRGELPACLREPIDWELMRQLADEQAVTGLVADALQQLPDDLWPSRRERIWWFGVANMIAEQNRKMNEEIARLVQVLHVEAIPYSLFKGQSIGTCYPHPEMRQSGDVDFYVPMSDFQRAKEVIEQRLMVKIEGEEQSDKHDQFDYEGIRFELHYRLETFGTKGHQSAFDQLIEQSFASPAVSRPIGEVLIRILPPAEELMVTFKHLFNHLLMEGVGLRQLCDLVILMRHFPQTERAALHQELKLIGYEKAFLSMSATLVKYLGMTESELPLPLESSHYRWADRLIAVPLSRGNFGKNHRRNRLGWMRRVDTASIALGHCLQFLPLAPTDILGLLPTRCRIAWRHKR